MAYVTGTTRLAELLGGLLLAADLANGFPPEKSIRTALLATELAKRVDANAHDAYYVTLLRFAGCTGFAHEEAHAYGAGDDRSVRQAMALADPTAPGPTLRAILGTVGKASGTLDRARAIGRLVLDGRAAQQHAHAQCDVSMRMASLVGLSPELCAVLAQVCERYDGKGAPHHLRGDALTRSVRLLHFADTLEIVHHRQGREAALAEVRRRSGKHLDPELVKAFEKGADALFSTIEGASVWERFLDAEPTPHEIVKDPTDVARAFALFTDVKSVYRLGHSFGVARLCVEAAVHAGIKDAGELERAGLLHDIGCVSVENGVWDKPGPLNAAEWERVRLHAYYTERIVRRVWEDAARIASSSHERLDGSGYHRAVPGTLLGVRERILAVADALHSLTEARPHRPALKLERAVDVLRKEVGRLDRAALDCVVAAAHGAKPEPKARGLSDREMEVLKLVARGNSNKEIALLLGISARTVQNHVAHIYDKIGVYSRAGAALYVMENGFF